MKQRCLLLAILIFQTNLAQDPRLFENTWYLRTVQLDDLAPIYTISEIDPPNAPLLIISEDFNFNGEGVCNFFNGTYNFNSPNYLTATNFAATLDDCNMQIYSLLEDAYFWYISHEFWFDITQDGGGAVLTMGNVLGGTAVFNSYPLSIEDFYSSQFSIHPNPAIDKLYITTTTSKENLTLKNLQPRR